LGLKRARNIAAKDAAYCSSGEDDPMPKPQNQLITWLIAIWPALALLPVLGA